MFLKVINKGQIKYYGGITFRQKSILIFLFIIDCFIQSDVCFTLFQHN